jgi:RHS repeat-associated protein
VWLDGRSVAMILSSFDSSWNRQADLTGTCQRNGDAAYCGVYFVVTDHIGKPVLALDSNRLISGIGEYDPFGRPNRVEYYGQTGIPYANNQNVAIANFSQPVQTGMTIDLRADYHLVDTEAGFCGTDSSYLTDNKNGGAQIGTWSASGYHQGRKWSPWVTPVVASSQVDVDVKFVSGAANRPPGTLRCTTGTYNYTGVIIEGFEYRKYQPNTKWKFTALRFPGMYHDWESENFENWNRFYDPAIGRYLQPEPLALRKPTTSAIYAYGTNNPIRNADPSGKYVQEDVPWASCGNWSAGLALARTMAGCGQGHPNSCNACQQALPCDICPMLEDGTLPRVRVRDLNKDRSWWDFSKTSGETVNENYNGTGFAEVKIDGSLCTGPENVADLAATLIHEATHACWSFGKGALDPEAGQIEKKCRGAF